MSDLRAKMAVWRFTTDEVIRFIMYIPGDGIESNEENVFRDSTEEGNAEFDPADVSNGSDSDYPEEKKTQKKQQQ